jgi:hypothetical protein
MFAVVAARQGPFHGEVTPPPVGVFVAVRYAVDWAWVRSPTPSFNMIEPPLMADAKSDAAMISSTRKKSDNVKDWLPKMVTPSLVRVTGEPVTFFATITGTGTQVSCCDQRYAMY